jgi:hypothetical protein
MSAFAQSTMVVVESCEIAQLRLDIRSGIQAMLQLETSMQQCTNRTISGIMKTAYDDICANVLRNVRRFPSYAQEHAIDREIAFLVGDVDFAPETVSMDTLPEYSMQFEGRLWASYLTQTRELLCNCLRYEDHVDLYVYYMPDKTPTFMERAETESRELAACRFLSIRENIERSSGTLAKADALALVDERQAAQRFPIDSFIHAFQESAELELSSAAVPIEWSVDRVGNHIDC